MGEKRETSAGNRGGRVSGRKNKELLEVGGHVALPKVGKRHWKEKQQHWGSLRGGEVGKKELKGTAFQQGGRGERTSITQAKSDKKRGNRGRVSAPGGEKKWVGS